MRGSRDVLFLLTSMVLASIPVGYLLVRIFLKQDVRSVGSGNIGATNVLRSGGKGLGARLFGCGDHFSPRSGHSEPPEDFFRLVFVNLHRPSISARICLLWKL